MSAESQRILRNLCSNTGWHYAVYWKLRQHHSRMVLTWEDAYFVECGQSHRSKNSYEAQGCIPNARFINDSIKFTLTAASYDVHPFGEGIIGKVAASGKHQWVFGDEQKDPSSSCIEELNGWRSQFAIGIKTVAFIAAAPHDVVQLGSLYKIYENMKLVDQIKNSLSALQLSSVNFVPKAIPNNGVEDNDCRMQLQQESVSKELGEVYSKMIDGIIPQPKVPMDVEARMIPLTSNMESVHGLGGMEFPFDNTGSAFPFHVSDRELHDRVNFDYLDQYQTLLSSSEVHDPSGVNPDIQAILGHSESSNASLRFSAGCELHEALGPAFSKQLRNYDKHVKAGKVKNVGFSEGMSSSSNQIAPSSGSENLLEAVVANIFNNVEDSKSERTSKSMLTSDHMPEMSYEDHMNLQNDPLSSYPSTAKEDMNYCLRASDMYFTSSPTMLSSTCVSSCTEPISKSSEASKGNKKRARPGESSKPRPRDRQLIQDRIKELRELIPSGAKCSIDSLLERTIKHMQFMQNMTEHADKLKQCAESKMQSKDAVESSSSSHEQGSSWAVEVGGQFKVCRILVENVNMNRQMLIEMLCEECSHFLEIAEVIKNLGLTILKGATEACGEKTWICFLVEGQKNKSIQRLDILWSLVHVLQPKNPT